MKTLSPSQKDTIWFQWYEVPRTVKSTETENRTVVARGLGIEESWKLLFNGSHVSVGEVEYFLQMDCGGTSTTMWIYLMLLNCTLKIGSSGKFYVTCFTTIKKKVSYNKTQPTTEAVCPLMQNFPKVTPGIGLVPS